MAVKTTLSTRPRRVHPTTRELIAVLALSVALWGPVVAWAAGA